MNHISLVYWRQYNDALQQVLTMLQNRKHDVALGIWLTIVNDKKEEIILNPYSYLGTELSLHERMNETVERIFHDFLRRELLLR